MPAMNQERYQRIKAIFDEICDLSHAEREIYLDSCCGDDEELRTDIEAILAQDRTPGIDFDEVGSDVCELLSEAAAHGSESSDAPVPASIGPYRILDLLGEGGMGVVYRAEQDHPKRTVALKMIRPGLTTPSLMRRFELEANILGRLQHAGIAQIHAASTAETGFGFQPYLVMEYVDGLPLLEYAATHDLSTEQRLSIFLHICAAVEHAHQKGVIHRDLKPTNILVDDTGQPKVLDFGVARATDPDGHASTLSGKGSQLIGTVPYMSPEQIADAPDDVDTRSDVYAMGVILFELLSGRLPYKTNRRSFSAISQSIREEPPVRLGAVNRAWRGDLETIVAKALEKEKTNRYQTVREFAQDLSRYRGSEPIHARPASRFYTMAQFVRRNRAASITAMVSTVVLIAATVISITFAIRAAEQRNRAQRSEQVAIAETERAERETERARLAKAEATQRAQELQIVADFQSGQLALVDPAMMGLQLRGAILKKQREHLAIAGHEGDRLDEALQDLERSLAGVNFTTLAIDALDDNFLATALWTIEEQFDDQPLIRAQLLHALGKTAQTLGSFETSLTAATKCLEIRRAVLGESHEDTVEAIARMGGILLELGRYEEAMSYFDDALQRRRRLLGEEHPETLSILTSTAIAYSVQGNYSEAISILRRVLNAQRRLRGDGDRATLTTQFQLGNALLAAGRAADAEPHLLAAAARRERILGAEHTLTLKAKSMYGFALVRQGRFADAEPVFRDALKGFRHTLGDEHPDTLTSMSYLAYLHQVQGEHAAALSLFRDALEQYRRTLGDHHPNTLSAIGNVGSTMAEMGTLAEAEPYFRKALKLRQQILGDDHPETLGAIHNLAYLLAAQGKMAESESYSRLAYKGLQQTLGAEHHRTLIARASLAMRLVESGRYEEAVELLEPMLDAAHQNLSGQHLRSLGDYLSTLGTAFAGLTLLDAAEGALLEAYPLLHQHYGESHERTRLCASRLIELYQTRHDLEPDAGYDSALEVWRAELASLDHPG